MRFPGATLSVAVAVCLAVSAARAADPPGGTLDDPLIGDRPDFTESAVTVSPGRVQVEAGATYGEAGRDEALEIGEVLVRVGLLPRLELRIGLNSYARVDSGRRELSGLVDSSLGAKVALGEARGWTTAVLVATSLPTGSREFREPDLQPEAVFVAERDLSESVSLGTNFGYAYASADGRRVGEALGSAALGVAVTERVGAFFEVFGIVPLASGEPETYFVDAGLTRSLSPDFQIDFRVGAGLNSAAADFFTGAGLVWRH